MKFYFCRVYDGTFYLSGCTFQTLTDRILIKFLFMLYWDIHYNKITQILSKGGIIRIEYKNATGTSFVEIITAFSINNDKLESEIEKIGIPIQYYKNYRK